MHGSIRPNSSLAARGPANRALPALPAFLALAALFAAPGAFAQNTTPKADAPTLTGGDRQITLSWSNPAGLTGVTNRIRYREKGTSNWTFADADGTTTGIQNFGHVTSATIPAHESFTMKDDTTYQVQLRHGKWGNYSGWGEWSDTAEADTDPGPTLAASSVEDTTATLTITYHDGTTWYYKANAAPDSSCSSTAVSGGTKSLSNLTPGTNYTYKAYSDSTCNTELTTDSTDADFLTKPGKATGLSLTAGGESLTANWTAVTSATLYLVQWKTSAQEWDATNRQVTSFSTSEAINTLTNGTEYTVRVRARNGTGPGDWSDTASGTPAATLAASSVEAGTATLTISGHTGNWYYQGNAAPDASCSSSAVSGATTNLSNLTSATSYTYKAYSDSACATEVTTDSTDAEFLTKPGQVTGVSAATGAGSLAVSWTAVTGAASYKVQWKTSAQEWDATNRQTTSTTNSKTLTLTNQTQYSIRVAATNTTGDGAWSSEITATPKASLTASNVQATTATLTIAGHAGSWYYKANAAPDASCSSSAVTGATKDLTNLTTATNYTYKAYSDSNCATELTTDALDADFLTKPAQVTGLTVGSNDRKLNVSWTAVSGAASYKVQWKTSTQNWSADRQSTETTTTETIPRDSLVQGSEHTVRVAATNGTGDGAWSATATATPAAATFTASAVTLVSATLTLNDFIGAWAYRRTAPSTGSCVVVASAYTADLTQLDAGTAYTYTAYSRSDCYGGAKITDGTFTTQAAPSVAASDITHRSATLTMSDHTGGWWYKKTAPSSGDCTAVADGTTTASVTGLNASTSYTYKVYDAANCPSANELDSATFTTTATPTLTADTITATAAKLTLANHTGNWWYQKTAPSSGNCTAAGSGATASLGSLTGGTSYTYKAYSAANCPSADELASESFTTPSGAVALTASAITTGGVTLTLSGYKGNWWYEHGIGSAAQCNAASASPWRIEGFEAASQLTIKAFSAANCPSANELDSVTFTTLAGNTPTMSVDRVRSTSARLNILNHNTTWWYRGNQAGAICTEVAQGTTSTTVTGLKASTSYTYEVYSTSACYEASRIALWIFTTLQPVALSTSSVANTSATLNISNYPDAWWYQGSQAGAQCTKVTAGTSTASLANLTAGVSYTYEAYSASGCASGNSLASHSFRTTGQSATDIGVNSATLNVGGLTDAWSYRGNQQGAACQNVAQGAYSVSLTNLNRDTQYTYTVYSRESCAGNSVTVSFSTLAAPPPTLTAGSVAQTTATLSLANHLGNWWHKRTAPSATNCTAGTSPNLTGLTASTSYTYEAYSDSSCTTKIATHSFSTLGAVELVFENIQPNRAHMKIRNWTGGVFSIFEKPSNRGGICDTISRMKGSNRLLQSNLEAGTQYTFSIYRGADCVSANLLDTESFTTLAWGTAVPELTATTVGNTSATLTLTNHTGDWWYENFFVAGSCTKVDSGTYTADLSNLTANTSYEYRAYSHANCFESSAPITWWAIARFNTTGPISASITDTTSTSVTLAVSGISEGKWSYSYRKTGSRMWNRCTAHDASTTSTVVSGLESGTAYDFHVYRGASCKFRDQVALNTHTISLSAGSIGQASATLKLENYQGAWHHKQAESSAGAQAQSTASAQGASSSDGCTGPVNGGTANVGGLTADTEYTWKAYKAAGCADADEIASATFSTLKQGQAPVAEDLKPSFASSALADQSYRQGVAIDILRLPVATGGDGTLTYTLSPDLPAGLSFDALSLTISGTPTEAVEAATYIYTATDADADSASLPFTLAVAANPEPATDPAPMADLAPSFAAGAAIADLVLAQNRPADAVTLPEATGGDGDLTYALSPSLPAGLVFDMATRTLSGTPTEAVEAAAYTWTATDADANDPDSATLSFAITVAADLAPSFAAGASIADLGFTQNRPADAVTLPEASGGDGDLTYALSPALPAGLSFDAATRTLSGTPTEAVEAAAYAWTATDADANDPDSATLSFAITVAADLAPSFAAGASVADLGFVQNSPVEAMTLPEASGGDGDLAYTLSPALPAGLSFDAATRTLSGTPAEAAESATYTYTVTDSDEFGPDSASLTFALSVAADLAPSFAAGVAIADLGFVQNSPADPVGLPEADGGDGALTYTLSPALPAGLSFDAAARTLSGTPSEAAESALYTYMVTDSDDFGPDSASLTFALSVAADLAPSFAEGAAIADLALQQTIPIDSRTLPEAEGGDGDLTYTLSPALPAGLSFDAATRTLSGTPSEAAESATFTYTVTDSDEFGPDSASLTFAVAVAADTAPSFNGARIAGLRLARSQAMAALALPEATGGNGELAYSLSPALPAGLSFDPATRVLSGTPTEIVGAQTYEYSVTDSDPLEPDGAALAFSIEVTFSAADQQVLNDALAAQGRALLTSATNVIGERFRTPEGMLAESGQGEERDRTAAALNALAGWLAGSAASPGRGPAGAGLGHGVLGTPAMAVGIGAGSAAAPAGPVFGAGGAFGKASGFGQAGEFGQAASFGQAGRFGQAGGFGVAGTPSAASPSRGFNLGQLLHGRRFALPLNAAGASGASAAASRRWVLWGAAADA